MTLRATLFSEPASALPRYRQTEMISPDSLDLHGQDQLGTDTCEINLGRGPSARSEFNPNDDDLFCKRVCVSVDACSCVSQDTEKNGHTIEFIWAGSNAISTTERGHAKGFYEVW